METMDEDAVRRLNAVQLEDLGTARREYISTVDTNNKIRNVTIEAIEAAREANKKGSAVHRLAEKNKDSLNAWNNAWQTMSEEVDLEDLDPLMGGQTHRAHLSAFVKENGGQNYGKIPVRAKPPLKAQKPVGVAGRGAVASTRGRGGFHARPPLDSPHGRPLDPARDCNNKGSPPRGISKKRGDMLGGMRRPPKPPTLRTRRVAGPSVVATYNNLLADSSEFMSAISNLIQPKPPVLPASGADQTQDRGNVKNTPSAAKLEVIKEAVEPEGHENKSIIGRVITPPVTDFGLQESPGSDEGTPIVRTGKLNLKGIGSIFPAANKQSCSAKKVQETSLLDSNVDPLSSDSTTLNFSASSKPDPRREELANLVKLLANSSLMPAEAVSYLEGRKQALERELGKATAKPQSPLQSSAAVRHDPEAKLKREHADDIKFKTEAESNFELVAKRARKVFAQTQDNSPTQLAPALNRPVETIKNSTDVITPAVTPAQPKIETRSIHVPSKPTLAKKPIVKFPGTPSAPSAAPVGEARFSIKADETVSFKGVHISDRDGNIIGDHLLPGRKAHQPPSAPRNPLLKGPVHSSPKAERIPAQESRIPRQEPIATPKEEAARAARPISITGSKRTPPVIVAENRLPVQKSVRPLSMENKAARIAIKEEGAPPAPTQPAPVAKFRAVDVPNIPMTAATMQYFKGQFPQAVSPKAPSTDNAKPDGLPKAKGASPVEEPRELAQPAPGPKFQMSDAPTFPMTAATMQFFGGQMTQTIPPEAPSVSNAKPDEIPESKGAFVEPEPDAMVIHEEEPHSAVKKEREMKPENSLPMRDLPKIPVNAATLQYAKHLFQENPQALEPQHESAGNVEQGLTPSRQRAKHTLSPNARPFDPPLFNKENADPQSTFIERMENKGVSAKKGTGVYSSRYAN